MDFSPSPSDIPTLSSIIRKIQPNQNFYELICDITPFYFSTDDPLFNELFLGPDFFKETDILEFNFKNSYQKTTLINYILINLFTQSQYLKKASKKEVVGEKEGEGGGSRSQRSPEAIYIDSGGDFNILAFHSLIQDVLLGKKEGNQWEREELEAILENILGHLKVLKVYTKEQMRMTLKALKVLIRKNKNIKMVILDTINNNNIFGHYHVNNNTSLNFDSNRYFNYNKTNQEINKYVTILKEIREIRNFALIVTRKINLKMGNQVFFNNVTKNFEVIKEVVNIMENRLFLETKKNLVLLGLQNFDENCITTLFNDFELIKRIETWGLKNNTVQEVISNGNLSFVLKKREDGEIELICYNINKSGFNIVKKFEANVWRI